MTDPKRESTNPWSRLDPSGEGLIVLDFLTTRISALISALRRKLTMPYAADIGLSVSEWRLLSLIAHAGTIPFGELVEQSTSDKSLVSKTIRLLEQRKLIEIGPESETAKKKIACSITPEGQALHDKAIGIARRRQAEILCTLTAEEREAFFNSIVKLQAAVDREAGG